MRGLELLAAGGAMVLLVACGDDGPAAVEDSATSAPLLVEAGPVAATELVIGDCLTGVVVGVEERTQIDSARVVSCEHAHELEVFASFEIDVSQLEVDPPGAYPGQERIVGVADEGCTEQIEEVGDPDTFGVIALWPTPESWNQGDRTVACAAYPADGSPFEGRVLLADS